MAVGQGQKVKLQPGAGLWPEPGARSRAGAVEGAGTRSGARADLGPEQSWVGSLSSSSHQGAWPGACCTPWAFLHAPLRGHSTVWGPLPQIVLFPQNILLLFREGNNFSFRHMLVMILKTWYCTEEKKILPCYYLLFQTSVGVLVHKKSRIQLFVLI